MHLLMGTDTLSGQATQLALFMSPFWITVFFERNEFAPFGSQFFALSVHLFSESACEQDSK